MGVGAPPATCDIRFSLQNRRARQRLVERLSSLGIANSAVTISGRATMSEREISEEAFVTAKQPEIEARLNTFLDRHPALLRADDQVILDMEPRCISPRQLGEYEGQRQLRLIRAYARRIRIARKVLRGTVPRLRIGLYQVIVPDGKGRLSDGFTKRMQGYVAAADGGMYDRLDFICPVLYQRFGPKDGATATTLRKWIAASTRQGLEGSLTLTRRDHTPIPLVPILSFWVFNGGSKSNRDAVSPESVAAQLEIVQGADRVEAILLWSGWQTRTEMETATDPVEPIAIAKFLDDTGSLPWPGCN